MHKNVFGRQFKRDANERKALFKNLLTSLVLQEQIITTHAKAKAIRGAADKLITKAKKGGDSAYRSLLPDVNYDAVKKLVEEIAPRFANRHGGYTRIIKLAKTRVADNAAMVVMQWVEKNEKHAVQSGKVNEENKQGKDTEKKITKRTVKAENDEVVEKDAVVARKAKAKSQKPKLHGKSKKD